MRILLTGSTGFIGRRLLALLIERGHEVWCLVRPGTTCPAGGVPLAADLATDEAIAIETSLDVVLHLAQSARYREFPDAADDIFAVNTASTARLLDLARRRSARFVLASTGSVYAGAVGRCDEERDVRPVDFYAVTKLAAEALLRSYTPLLPSCALRLFAPYGPGQRDRLIANLIERVSAAEPVRLDGDADGLRLAATYVDDATAVFVAAAEHGWEGVYNVAAPEPISVRGIATIVARLLGVAPIFERTGRPEPTPIIPELGRLAARRDVAAFTPLEKGLAITLGI